MEFQYYCQTEIQNILDHIVPIPDDLKVSKQYLYGLEQADFVNAFINAAKDYNQHIQRYAKKS